MGLDSGNQTGADLVHKPEDGKRPPIAVGNWVVCCPPFDGWGGKLSLHMVLDGPRYEKAAGHCVDELWKCDDGIERSRYHLTPIDLVGLSVEARAAASCVRSCMRLDQPELDALAVRSRRAAELASGHWAPRPTVEVTRRGYELAAIIGASEELDAAIAARTSFTQFSLPILVKNLHNAGALAKAEQAGGVVVLCLLLLGIGETP